MSRFRLLLASLVLVSVAAPPGLAAQAQRDITITGRVLSETGQPIANASVLLRPLNIGTTTRANGSYTLTVPAAHASEEVTLAAQTIGYRTQSHTITLQAGAALAQDFQLSKGALELDAIVVTGIGQAQTRERLGVSIASVSGEAVTQAANPNIVSALAGKAPNVEVAQQGGEPGSGAYIRIRGVNTIIGNGQPLFIVDGVPINNQQLNPAATVLTATVAPNRASDVNPNDIVSIEVLKGAAAAAVYGARAANGVVLITTRAGQPGATRTQLVSTVTIDQVNKAIPLQRSFGQGAIAANGDTIDGIFSWGRRLPASTPTYDHFGELFRDGQMFDTNLSVSGGTDRTPYYISAGRMDHRGIMQGPNSYYNRSTVRLRASHRLLDNLNVGGNVAYVETSGSFIQQGSNISGLFLGGLRTPPEFNNQPHLTPDGWHRSYRLPNPTGPGGSRGYDNPFFVLYEQVNTAETGRVFGNVSVEYSPLPWLVLNYTLGNDYTGDDRVTVFPITTASSPSGQIIRATYITRDIDSNLLATATHSVTPALGGSLTLGWNRNSRDFRQNMIRGDEFVTPRPYNINNTVSRTPNEFQSRINSESFFGQGQLDVAHQLFVTLALRNDGFSTFGVSERRHWYPKASAAWDFTRALGLERGQNPLLGFGKVRLAWGQAGNEPPAYATVSALQFTPQLGDAGWLLPPNGLNPIYMGRGGVYTSLTQGQDSLKPERTTETEVGLDVSLLRDRLGLEVTWYNALTVDAILFAPVPPSTGYTQQMQNAARIRNRGFEVAGNLRVVETRRFAWALGGNWATNDNRVLELAEGIEFVPMFGGFAPAPGAAVRGERVGVLRGNDFYRCHSGDAGLPASIAAGCQGASDGAVYIGADGRPVVDPRVTVIGDPHPDWTAGIRNEFTLLGRVRVSSLIDIKHGGDMWNGTRGALLHWGTHADTEIRGERMTYGRYSGEAVAGPGKDVEIPFDFAWFQGLGSGFGDNSAQFIEDAGYTKLREVAVSYAVPTGFARRLGMSGIDLRVAGRNLHTWTKYSGIDPETNLAGNTNLRGIDYFNNPQTRSWVFTATLNR